jgi:hypothetical protein
MIKEIKIFFEYLKRLFKKWYAYLPILPDLLDKIQSHLEYTIPVSSNILNIFALFALLYATYQVWNDMRLEKLELEEKLINPIDYEVKANIKKVKIDLIYIESLIDKNIEKTQSLIHSAEQELEKIVINENDEIKSLATKFSSGIYPNSEIFYKNDLKDYIKLLKDYQNKKDDYLLEWKNFSDIELKDIYIVDFYITNTGKFDEDIDIEIHFNDENKYIGEFFLLDNFPSSSLPSKPKKNKEMDFHSRNILNELDIRDRIRTQANLNPLTYKRFEEIKENIFSVKLRNLKASETVDIFRNNGYFIRITDKNDIDIIISSKNSTSKINKKLVYEDNGEFDYFQDKKD